MVVASSCLAFRVLIAHAPKSSAFFSRESYFIIAIENFFPVFA